MFTIAKRQSEALSQASLQKFEDKMVVHVREYFPNHFAQMGEEPVRKTIQLAVKNGEPYGIISQRNVCLYLNSMLVLGSFFDTDPAFKWAGAILNDASEPSALLRADRLAQATEDFLLRVNGEKNTLLHRALLTLSKDADRLYELLVHDGARDISGFCKQLFPSRFENLDAVGFEVSIRNASLKAGHYGKAHPETNAVISVFMFLCGHGFDRDPQFDWAGRVMNDSGIAAHHTGKELYRAGIEALQQFLQSYKND